MDSSDLSLKGKRATVMGLGWHGGGVSAARFLAQAGAIVTVTDVEDADRLRPSLQALSGVSIERYCLTRHDEADFRDADLVVVNPAVKPENPFVQIARQRGARICTEIGLFWERCPARVAAVTGTVGKSTTAAMLTTMLAASGKRAWLGGNIGASLLPQLHRIRSRDVVVLEISSAQLAWQHVCPPGPDVAIITNCRPHHLDWHADYAGYVAAKKKILGSQRPGDLVVFPAGDPEVSTWQRDARGEVGFPVDDGSIGQLRIPGKHARHNAAQAARGALRFGCDWAGIDKALRAFRGLPHRLEVIGTIDGRTYVNDSKGTTPAATLAALEGVDQETWIILGGHDAGEEMRELAIAVTEKTLGAATYGPAGERIAGQIRLLNDSFPLTQHPSLAEAVRTCVSKSQPGQIILLSPACASFGEFSDYRERGRAFVRMVGASSTTACGAHGIQPAMRIPT